MDSITTRRLSPDREVEKASWAAIRELCCRTGDNGQAIAKERWDFFPRIWIDPYERLVPQWTCVAVVQEAIVGYLTGCPDSRKFSRSKAWRVTFPLLVQIGFGRYHNTTGAREFARYRSHGSQASGAIAAGKNFVGAEQADGLVRRVNTTGQTQP